MLSLLIDSQRLAFAAYASKPTPRLDYDVIPLPTNLPLCDALQSASRTLPMLQKAGEDDVQVLVQGEVTLVPIADFEEEHITTLYDYCVPPKEGEPRRVMYDLIPSAGAALLFSVSEATHEAVTSGLGMPVHYVSAVTPLLRHLMTLPTEAGKSSKHVYAYVQAGRTLLVILSGHRLLMLNTYETHSAEDVAYYLLQAAASLGIQTDGDAFHIMGTSSAASSAYELLTQYVVHLNRLTPKESLAQHASLISEEMPYELLTLLLS